MAAKDATSIGSNIVTGGSSHDEHNIGPAGRAPDKTGVPVGFPVKDQRELATSTSVRRENGSPEVTIFLGSAPITASWSSSWFMARSPTDCQPARDLRSAVSACWMLSFSQTASATSPPRHQTRTLGNRIKSRRLKANTNRSAVQGQFELAHIAVATRIVHVDAPTRLYIHLMQMMAG
jgi:hypothetical protein